MSLALPVLLRMHFIDSLLYCYGWLDRSSLIDYFGIGPAQASRDLKRYLELAPGNMIYLPEQRAYMRTMAYKRFELHSLPKG